MERIGKFITFEGCDGCGKSTQLKMLSDYLTENNIPHIFTREPGGGKISEAIREILLNGKNSEMTDECEALLYAAARVQHLRDRVQPALDKGELVVCDRYFDSSFAYQAYARGLGVDFIGKINVDEETELAQKFGVMSIPTLVVIKNGNIVNQSTGAKPKAQILAMLAD